MERAVHPCRSKLLSLLFTCIIVSCTSRWLPSMRQGRRCSTKRGQPVSTCWRHPDCFPYPAVSCDSGRSGGKWAQGWKLGVALMCAQWREQLSSFSGKGAWDRGEVIRCSSWGAPYLTTLTAISASTRRSGTKAYVCFEWVRPYRRRVPLLERRNSCYHHRDLLAVITLTDRTTALFNTHWRPLLLYRAVHRKIGVAVCGLPWLLSNTVFFRRC